MSRDDSELIEPLPNSAAIRSSGLKGKIRRVLSLNASQVITEEESSGAPSSSSSPPANRAAGLQSNAADAGDAGSTATKQAKKKRTALFNSRLNASTDNISLSSTMSSASVVIRKLGSIGKVARRNSLAGITSLFKDKKDNDDTGESDGKKGKKKRGGKGEAAEASVSHVTAELDRTSNEWSAELNGLSPAAKLARQHTLKSNAEAAAKVRAQEEAAAAATAATDTATAASTSSGDGSQAPGSMPTTSAKNTTTNRGTPGTTRTNEAGLRVVVEDDDSGSEGESEHPHDYSAHVDGWEDEDWSHIDDDEDLTIRQGLEQTSVGGDECDAEPWAIGLRRSFERTQQPSKGILKSMRPNQSLMFMLITRTPCSQMLMVMTNTVLLIHLPTTAVTDPTRTTLILPKLTSLVLSHAFHRQTRTTLMAYAIRRLRPEHQHSFRHSRLKRMKEYDPRRKGRFSTTRTSTRVRRC